MSANRTARNLSRAPLSVKWAYYGGGRGGRCVRESTSARARAARGRAYPGGGGTQTENGETGGKAAASPKGRDAEPHTGRVPPCRRVTLHGITRLTPTQRSSQYPPSGSWGSRRDSFTPLVELWMNFNSPTYIPTCVTPEPGRAEKRRMSPRRGASTTGATSAPVSA